MEKKADELMTRDNFSKGLEFGERLKEFGCNIVKLDIRNATELKVQYKKKNIAQICPRHGCWYSVYRFWSNEKTVRVSNEKELNDLFDSFKAHCEQLDEKVKAKPTKTSKIEIIKPRTIASVIQQLNNLGSSKAMKIPSGIMPSDEEFVKAVEHNGCIIDWENRLIAKAKVSK